jgi:hypothetical protein
MMTAPAAVEADAPASDDLSLAAALNATAERGGHLFPPDEPEPPKAPDTPASDAPAPADQPKADDAPAPDSTTPEVDPASPPVDPAAADPFAALVKDAKPLAYRMNGAEHLHDTILEVPGKGAVIPADKLDEFRNYVARSESNKEAVRQLLTEREGYERIGGMAKIIERLETGEQINAATLKILDAVQTDPTQFVMVEDGKIVPNPYMLGLLKKEADLAAKQALWAYRETRTKEEQTYRSTAQQEEAKKDAIPRTIDAHFREFPEADRAAAKAYFGKRPDLYTFTVTAANAEQYGQPIGTMMVHADAIRDWLADRAASRPAAPTPAKTAAAKFNAAAAAPPKPAPPVSGAASYEDLT